MNDRRAMNREGMTLRARPDRLAPAKPAKPVSAQGGGYRVAVVAACPFPSLRGSQVLVRELAEQLAAAGNAVHVVTYPTAQHLVPVERIAIHRVPRLPGIVTARPFTWRKVFLDILLVFVLYRVVQRQRIHVIHAHNIEAPIIAYLVRWLTGVPVVYHAHNAMQDELPYYVRRRWLRRAVVRAGSFIDHWVAARADFCVALSDRLGAYLAVRGAAGRVVVIPPAANPAGQVWHPGYPSDDPVVMYAGNLDPYQDLDVLLDAFERVRRARPGSRLVLVTHRASWRQARQLTERLSSLPGVGVEEVPTFAATLRRLREASVVVCPRSSWSGFPIKVMNYMALGTPVIHAASSAHIIEHEVHGLLFEDRNPAALANAMLRLLGDPALAGRLGRQARIGLERRYSWDVVLPRFLDVYRRVLGEGLAETERQVEKDCGNY